MMMRKAVWSLLTVLIGAVLVASAGASGTQEGSFLPPVFKADSGTVAPDVLPNMHAYGISEGASSPGTYLSPSDTSHPIGGPLPGPYEAQANTNLGPGYLTRYYLDKPTWDGADPTEVVAAGTALGVNSAPEETGSISGQVLADSDSMPIASAWVYALDTQFDFVAGSYSQILGNYQIAGLPTGNYYIAVQAPGYGGVYYDNAYDDPSATLVTVNAPSDTPNIGFRLLWEATISGYVHESDGITPISMASVEVWPQHGGQIRSTVAMADGSFTVGGLSTGYYVAKAEAPSYVVEFYEEATSWGSATPIGVTHATNISGIDFTLDVAGSISGHVYAEDGITPLEGARLHARVPEWGETFWSTTDAQGAYTIEGLTAPEYIVMVYEPPPGYAYEYYGDTYDRHEATRVPVTPGQTTTGIDFALAPGGTVSGHVYDTSGTTPLRRIEVHLTDAGEAGIYKWAWTGSDGAYTVVGVPFADHVINATGRLAWGSPGDYAMEYWQEKTSREEADIVTVSASDPDIIGIDFTLEGTSAIAGHVYAQDGITPLEGARLHARVPEWGETFWSTTDAQGAYTIEGLSAPEYIVMVYEPPPGYAYEYYEDTYNRHEATRVPVTPGQTTAGIDFALAPGGTVSGRVVDAADSTPIENVEIHVVDSAGTGIYKWGHSAADGSYTVVGVPYADYRIDAMGYEQLGSGGYVREYWQEKSSESEADIVTVSGSDPNITGIDFTLEEGGSISGHVFKADGSTVITDVLISVHAHGISEGASSRGTYASQSDGSYTIGGLAPGTYKVEANNNREPGYVTKYYDNKATWDAADTVEVLAAQTTSGIDFTLEEAGAISGVVLDATGSNPIGRASIGITPSNTPWSYWSFCADDNGRFSIGQSPGSYKIFARGDAAHCGSDSNYAREFWQESLYWDDAETITLTVDAPNAVVTFTLELGGSIAGTVYDVTGTSTVGGGVVLATSVDELLNSFVCAEGDGSYTIPGLPIGDYKVQAFGYCGADPNYVAEYWREKDNWDDADVVTLSADNREMTGADFTLELGGVITGQVLMADGVTPVQDACVRVSSTAPEWNPASRYGITQSDGGFTISAVPRGDLYVRTDANCQGAHPDLQDEWYAAGDSTPDASLADTVAVRSGQTVTGVDFALDVASSSTVSPEEGGVLTSTVDVTTTLVFPSHAVSEPVTVTLKFIASQSRPTGFSFLGQSFSIEATAPDGTPVTTFSEPFTMTIHYHDDDVAGMDEASLAVYYWNESLQQWEEIPAEVNQDTNTITCVLDHLTNFAVLGEVKGIIYLPIILRNH